MKQRIYQIDAFADTVFSGNPAAVCIMEEWLPDATMQAIAAENNLAETAFAVAKGDSYTLRWFTPEVEVDLCGHATLAAAFTLFQYYGHKENIIKFVSPRSGPLGVTKQPDGSMTMDFPVDELTKIKAAPALVTAIGATPMEIYKGKTDYMLVYPDEARILGIAPNFHLLDQVDCRGVIVTAPGNKTDFVSRFFAPKCGITEDPVTGSAHTTLTPYWSKMLGKTNMSAAQRSKRGGLLQCALKENRVLLSGRAICYLVGTIII